MILSDKRNLDELIFRKILNIKNLKSFYTYLNEEQIAKITEKNYTIDHLVVRTDEGCKGELFYLQNKFPNLKSFYLDGEFHEKNENIELIENPNCKINNIYLRDLSNVKLYCNSYENLEACTVCLNGVINYNNLFPFNILDKKVLFKSIKTFKWICRKGWNIDSKFFEKFENILDSMPNLKNLVLLLKSEDLTRDLYMKLLSKILLMKKLKNIFCEVNDSASLLNKKLLKTIFPNIDTGHINYLFITEFKQFKYPYDRIKDIFR